MGKGGKEGEGTRGTPLPVYVGDWGFVCGEHREEVKTVE